MGPLPQWTSIGTVDLPLVISAFSLLVVFIAWLHTTSKRKSGDEPPLLPGSWPILGHALTFLKDSSLVHRTARYV